MTQRHLSSLRFGDEQVAYSTTTHDSFTEPGRDGRQFLSDKVLDLQTKSSVTLGSTAEADSMYKTVTMQDFDRKPLPPKRQAAVRHSDHTDIVFGTDAEPSALTSTHRESFSTKPIPPKEKAKVYGMSIEMGTAPSDFTTEYSAANDAMFARIGDAPSKQEQIVAEKIVKAKELSMTATHFSLGTDPDAWTTSGHLPRHPTHLYRDRERPCDPGSHAGMAPAALSEEERARQAAAALKGGTKTKSSIDFGVDATDYQTATMSLYRQHPANLKINPPVEMRPTIRLYKPQG